MALEERIGDRERETATSLLGDHYAEGRLDPDEYRERLDAIWSARTRSDLDQLFWDLPAVVVVPPPRAVAARPKSRASSVAWLLLLCVLAILVMAKAPWFVLGIVALVFFMRSRRHNERHHDPSRDRYRR